MSRPPRWREDDDQAIGPGLCGGLPLAVRSGFLPP
jgi:hypothetical protein